MSDDEIKLQVKVKYFNFYISNKKYSISTQPICRNLSYWKFTYVNFWYAIFNLKLNLFKICIFLNRNHPCSTMLYLCWQKQYTGWLWNIPEVFWCICRFQSRSQLCTELLRSGQLEQINLPSLWIYFFQLKLFICAVSLHKIPQEIGLWRQINLTDTGYVIWKIW